MKTFPFRRPFRYFAIVQMVTMVFIKFIQTVARDYVTCETWQWGSKGHRNINRVSQSWARYAASICRGQLFTYNSTFFAALSGVRVRAYLLHKNTISFTDFGQTGSYFIFSVFLLNGCPQATCCWSSHKLILTVWAHGWMGTQPLIQPKVQFDDRESSNQSSLESFMMCW